MKLYLAGPMRGYPAFNFPAFHAAAKRLRDAGHEVFNPAERDETEGFNPHTDEAKGMDYYMQFDLPEVCKADAVAVLPGWTGSTGAKLEAHVAKTLGKPVLDADSLEPVTNGAVKHDSAKPPMSLLPWRALQEVAKVLAFGAQKYEAHNWRQGFDRWSRMHDAAIRHLGAYADGERRDPESGLSHLAHAACMTLFLLTHELLGLGGDDMFKPK